LPAWGSREPSRPSPSPGPSLTVIVAVRGAGSFSWAPANHRRRRSLTSWSSSVLLAHSPSPPPACLVFSSFFLPRGLLARSAWAWLPAPSYVPRPAADDSPAWGAGSPGHHAAASGLWTAARWLRAPTPLRAGFFSTACRVAPKLVVARSTVVVPSAPVSRPPGLAGNQIGHVGVEQP